MSEPLKVAEPWNAVVPTNIDGLGLEVGKTYTAVGYYGGDSLDSNEGATRFSVTATATDASEMGLPNNAMISSGEIQTYYQESSGENENVIPEQSYSVSFTFVDGVCLEGESFVSDEASAIYLFTIGGSGATYQESAKNFVIESITEVEEV